MNKLCELGKRVDIRSIFRHLKLLKYLWYNGYHGMLKLPNRSLAIDECLPPSGLLTVENCFSALFFSSQCTRNTCKVCLTLRAFMLLYDYALK